MRSLSLAILLGAIISVFGCAEQPQVKAIPGSPSNKQNIAPPGTYIEHLYLRIVAGPDFNIMRAHVWLQIMLRRNESAPVDEAQAYLLSTASYDYGPTAKWEPKEGKTFHLNLTGKEFLQETLSGFTLADGMNVPNASDFEIAFIQIFGEDQNGSWWQLADFHPVPALQRSWLRDKVDAGDYPALPLPSMDWVGVPDPVH